MAPRELYALFMLLSLVAALAVRQWRPLPAPLVAVPRWKRLVIGLAAFTGGTLGAKLPWIVTTSEPLASPAVWLDDGKTIVAGLACGYLAVELAKWRLGVRVKTGDRFALPLAVAMAVGRWGCWFNGCCGGVASDLPWAVGGRHPTALYEVGFHTVMAGVLLCLEARGRLAGQRIKLYLLAYGGYRFVVEWIRVEPLGPLGLTVYQWAVVPLCLALVVQWRWDARRMEGTA